MDTHTLPARVDDALAAHVESLQEAFRRLPRGAAVREMAPPFVSVLNRYFPDSEVAFFCRSAKKGGWERLAGEAPAGEGFRLAQEKAGSSSWLGDGGTTLSFVHRLVDRSEVGLVLKARAPRTSYGDLDIVSLRLFCLLFDNAHQTLSHRRSEKDLVFSLNHRVLQLNSLIDTGIEVSKLDQVDSVHRLALQRAASLTNASKGLATIWGEKGIRECAVFPHGSPEPRGLGEGHRISSGFTFGGETYSFDLFEKESRAGIVPFEETDQLLLDALTRQVYASLENRSLLQQAVEKEKIERDLELAASIQQMIIPKSLPAIEGYDIAGINVPTKSVGGDYYNCLPMPDGRYALVIADVAGKGMPAALLVSSFHAYFGAYLETPMPLAQLAQQLNRAICHASPDDKFITAFVAMLTPATGEIESVNLGHNTVYLRRDATTLLELSAGGPPLGMLNIEFPYQTDRARVETGDRLLLYTDGVPEATNSEAALFESEVPLADYFRTAEHDQAQPFIDALMAEIRRFTAGAPQSDDITAMCLLRR